MAITVSEVLVRAWLAGALEPARARELQEELSARPGGLGAFLAERAPLVEADVACVWRLPPGALCRTLRAEVHDVPSLSGVAARIRVVIAPSIDLDDRVLLVLRRLGEDWEVVLPLDDDEVVKLIELRSPDGYELHLAAGDTYALAALPASSLPRPLSWSSSAADGVLARVAAREVPLRILTAG